MPPGEIERIGELLVEEGAVTQEDITRALTDPALRGSPLAALLEGTPHVRRAELAAFLAAKFRIPVLEDLRKIDIAADAVRLVPEEIARKHEVLPLVKAGDVLCVAKANYFNRAAIQELRKVSGLRIKVVQADELQVRAALDAVYKGKKGELPGPSTSVRRKDTSIRENSGSTARIRVPQQPAAADAMPLISMPENGSSAPALKEVSKDDDLNEVIEILDAVKMPAHEYTAALKDPLARLVLEFEDIFQAGRPASPVRVS